jgi:hypothetical protein
MTGTVQGARTWDTVTDLTDAFWSLHAGDGHGEATFAEARNARRRAERSTTVDVKGGAL